VQPEQTRYCQYLLYFESGGVRKVPESKGNFGKPVKKQLHKQQKHRDAKTKVKHYNIPTPEQSIEQTRQNKERKDYRKYEKPADSCKNTLRLLYRRKPE
jgi:hypothetical protein